MNFVHKLMIQLVSVLIFSLKKGYLEENNRCDDIDECQIGSHLCDSTICNNTIGSYECDCNSGFTILTTAKGTKRCIDQDECLLGTHQCDKNSKCINEEGAYRKRQVNSKLMIN